MTRKPHGGLETRPAVFSRAGRNEFASPLASSLAQEAKFLRLRKGKSEFERRSESRLKLSRGNEIVTFAMHKCVTVPVEPQPQPASVVFLNKSPTYSKALLMEVIHCGRGNRISSLANIASTRYPTGKSRPRFKMPSKEKLPPLRGQYTVIAKN